jgi:hypothetical protein
MEKNVDNIVEISIKMGITKSHIFIIENNTSDIRLLH